MAGDWEALKWGDIACLHYGKSLKGYKESTGNVRVFGTNGPIGWCNEPICDFSSIVIGRKGAYRGVHFADSPFFVIDTAFFLELKEKQLVDIKWAYYQLLTQDINGLDSGSAIPSTRREDFYHLTLSLPPLAEQKAIAHILGTLDDKIELNRRMNETLEEMARTLFKSWFVDFDPVRAKLDGRQPAGMDAETAALFPAEFQDSELGKIPKGWEVVPLGEVAYILNGHAFKSKDFTSSGIFLMRTRNFSQSGYVASTESDVFLPESFLESHPQYIAEEFDFHLVMVGASVGKTSLLFHHLLPVLRNQNMWCFRPKADKLGRFFLNFSVSEVASRVSGWATGSARSFFRKSDFQKHEIIRCSPHLMANFETQMHAIYRRISLNQIQSRSLASLRDTLLPKLLSGELQIKDAKKFVEDAV